MNLDEPAAMAAVLMDAARTPCPLPAQRAGLTPAGAVVSEMAGSCGSVYQAKRPGVQFGRLAASVTSALTLTLVPSGTGL